jgi:hypothetical protein
MESRSPADRRPPATGIWPRVNGLGSRKTPVSLFTTLRPAGSLTILLGVNGMHAMQKITGFLIFSNSS